jgi:hypothetical protein
MQVPCTNCDTPRRQGDQVRRILWLLEVDYPVIFSVRLEEIGERSFKGCVFVRIDIPPSIRAIKEGALKDCSWLITAILNNGLEEIGKRAFKRCAFVRIVIPSAIREIDEMAFKECLNLMTVRFCGEIGEFVSGGAMRDWWNHGVHEKCLSTYIFLVGFNILQRSCMINNVADQHLWNA